MANVKNAILDDGNFNVIFSAKLPARNSSNACAESLDITGLSWSSWLVALCARLGRAILLLQLLQSSTLPPTFFLMHCTINSAGYDASLAVESDPSGESDRCSVGGPRCCCWSHVRPDIGPAAWPPHPCIQSACILQQRNIFCVVGPIRQRNTCNITMVKHHNIYRLTESCFHLVVTCTPAYIPAAVDSRAAHVEIIADRFSRIRLVVADQSALVFTLDSSDWTPCDLKLTLLRLI